VPALRKVNQLQMAVWQNLSTIGMHLPPGEGLRRQGMNIAMKTYLIDPAQREVLVRDLTTKLAVTLALMMAAVIVVAGLIVWQMPSMSTTGNLLIMLAAVVALGVIIGYRMWGQIRDYRRGLESLQIGISEDRITRRQSRLPDLTIQRAEVVLLQETEAGVLVVAKDRSKYLWAPAQLADYAGARAALARWMVIHRAPAQPRGQHTGVLTVAWGLGTALCMGALLFAADPTLVVVAGIATLAIYLFVYRRLQAQRGIDQRFRRTYSGIFIFLVVVVAARVLMVLSPLMTNH
jgi:hypothetical protein